jgi:hypothetical protein
LAAAGREGQAVAVADQARQVAAHTENSASDARVLATLPFTGIRDHDDEILESLLLTPNACERVEEFPAPLLGRLVLDKQI